MKKTINGKIYDTVTSRQVAVYFKNGTHYPENVISFWQKIKNGELFYTIEDEIYVSTPKKNVYTIEVLTMLMAENEIHLNKIPYNKENDPFIVIDSNYTKKYSINEINTLSDVLSKYDKQIQDKVKQVLL